MSYKYNRNDHVFWFDTTKQVAEDNDVVSEVYTIDGVDTFANITAKAGAIEKWEDIYMSDGTDWLKSDGTKLTYYILTLTVGAGSAITVTSSDGKSYASGDRVYAGTSLTITASALTGYNLSVFTVNTVDKTASNPDTHVAAAAIAVVTEATEA